MMKIEVSLLAALLLMSTTLLARIAVQGIEPALVSIAIEWWVNGTRAGVRLFRKHVDLRWVG
jgi:hypothetical protein